MRLRARSILSETFSAPPSPILHQRGLGRGALNYHVDGVTYG
jgi:hypothetical protein